MQEHMLYFCVFGKGDNADNNCFYQAIAYMGDDFMFQLMGKYRDMALAVKNPSHLNIAACLIKLKRYDEAIGQCSIVCIFIHFLLMCADFQQLYLEEVLGCQLTVCCDHYALCCIIVTFTLLLFQVLGEDENNVKALFRRGKARAELGQTDAAREDFLKARKYAPEDRAIVKELRLLAEHDKAVYQKQKEMYKGILGKAPEPKPKQKNWLIFIWQWLVALCVRLFKHKRNKTD